MFGDKYNTDIMFGKQCGIATALVETGCNKRSDVENKNENEFGAIPDYVLTSLHP